MLELFSSRVSSSLISAFSINCEASGEASELAIAIEVQRPEDSSDGFVELSLGSLQLK
jgi:hypothetical protein